MKILGFQKMTMLDFPGKVACTAFVGGCNFRCPFCHNAALVTDIDPSLTFSQDEIISYLIKRKGIVDGICITGGEPLLFDETLRFMERIKNESGMPVKLDTNGSFPERLKTAVNNGLADYVAMDIKNSKEKYGLTIDIDNFDISPIEESVDFLMSGKTDYEFRTTVVKEFHTPQDIENIGHWIQGAEKYFLQNFVDSGNLIGSGMHAVSKETLEKFRDTASDFVKKAELRGV